jgi:uncharacterized protein YggE
MEQTMFPKWLVTTAVVVGGLAVALWGVDRAFLIRDRIENKNPQNTLSVSAQGKVSAKPDLATINLGVLTNATDQEETRKQNTNQTNKLIDFIKAQGVTDITTSQFSLYPQQDYQGGRSTITGYQANQTVTVKIRGIDMSMDVLNKVLDGAVKAGANQINSVDLSIDDPDKFRGQAREQAIEKAKAKAQELAGKAGIKLGRVVNVSEGYSSSGNMPYPMMYDAKGGMGGGMANIQGGQQDVIAEMNVIFEVK